MFETGPRRAMTHEEQERLLKVTRQHVCGMRDYILFAVALHTGLREHELCALNIGDVTNGGGQVKGRIRLKTYKRPPRRNGSEGSRRPSQPQEVFLSDTMRRKLARYLTWKRAQGHPMEADSPLFLSRHRRRLSKNMALHAFKTWQSRAGFDQLYTFHEIRHSACSSFLERERDLRLTQRFARHANIRSTAIYTHPSDEALIRAVQKQPC